MAISSTAAATNPGGLQEAMSCDVCSEVYERTLRTPLVLPCGHTFCRACLVALKTTGHLSCPSCRVTHYNVQVEALTVNYTLLNILPFCSTVTHDKCTTHGDDLRYWCCTCDLPLCSLCLYSGHPQGHTVKLAQSFVEEKKLELTDKIKLFFGNIKAKEEELKGCFSDFDKSMVKLFQKNVYLQDKLVTLTDLLNNTKRASDITSIKYFEKAVKDFQCMENAPSGTDASKEKAKDSEVAVAKAAKQSSEPCQEQPSQDENLTRTHRAIIHSIKYFEKNLKYFQYMNNAPSGTDASKEKAKHSEVAVAKATKQSSKPCRKQPSQDENLTQTQRAIIDFREGRMLLHSLATPASIGLFLQVPSEVFLELSVGDQCLGHVFISLWCHLRRAQQMLALCMGTMGPCLLDTKASEKSNGMLRFYYVVDGSNKTRNEPLLTDLEWGGQYAKKQNKGYIAGINTYESGMGSTGTESIFGSPHRSFQFPTGNSVAFGICLDTFHNDTLQAPFGRVIGGQEVLEAACQHNPITEVTITHSGLVLPGLSLSNAT